MATSDRILQNITEFVANISMRLDTLDGYVDSLETSLLAIPRTIAKTDGAVLNGADDLFVITGGPILVRNIIGIVTTVIGGAANGTLQAAVTAPEGTVALSTTVAIDADAVGTSYDFVGPTGILTPTTAGARIRDYGSTTLTPSQWIVPIGTINFLGSAAQTGVIAWYMEYVPLSPLSVVTAAA